MGKYTNPDIIQDPLAKALAQTSKDVGKAAVGYIAAEENKRKLDELRKNKLNEDLYSIDQAVNSIPSSEDEVFDDNFKAMLKEELTNVNKLGMQAIKSGDNCDDIYYDLWQTSTDRLNQPWEVCQFSEITEYRIYERVYKRNLWWVGERRL